MNPSYYIIFNPASTHATRGLKRIAELKTLVGETRVHVIETLAGGREANRRLLERQTFEPEVVLAIAAGDGTVGLVVETLVLSPHLAPAARHVPILPLWGGNANDLANMLSGSRRQPLRRLLAQARIVVIRPLECRLSYPDGRLETRIAAGYMSFGATAYAAAHLTTPRHRANPLHRLPGVMAISEFAASINGFLEAPLFTIRENGSRHTIYERLFLNGSRLGKLNFQAVKLTEPEFFLHTAHHKRAVRLVSQMWDMATRRTAAHFHREPITFTCEDRVMAQFDGEPTELPAGTTVTVALAVNYFRALSTRLEPTA